MDVLSDLLRTVRFKSVVYFKHDFAKPWGMSVPKGNFAQFHFVVKGQCVVKLKTGNEIPLTGGDVIVFPHGLPHKIMDRKGRKCMAGQAVVQGIVSGREMFSEGERSATLICGHFELDRDFEHPFFQSLPDYIHINGYDREDKGNVHLFLHMLVDECSGKEPGSEVVSVRLGEVLFVKILRDHMRQEISGSNFLHALNEPLVSAALGLMHGRPEAGWSLDNLAFEVGASRTAFFTKFKKTLGTTPMKYLTQWRMIKAKQLLRGSRTSVFEVAEKVGYGSQASFIRAFKQQYGQTPTGFRRGGGG